MIDIEDRLSAVCTELPDDPEAERRLRAFVVNELPWHARRHARRSPSIARQPSRDGRAGVRWVLPMAAAAVVLIVAALVAAIRVGDGHSGRGRVAPAASTVRPEPRAAMIKHVVGIDLPSPVTWEYGALRFAPPPHNSTPGVSADSVLAAYIKTGVFIGALGGREPAAYLASMTSYDRSTTIDPSTGLMVPDTRNELVWLIQYDDVPGLDYPVFFRVSDGQMPSPGASRAPATEFPTASMGTGSEAPGGLVTVLVVANAANGKIREVMTGLADVGPEPIPSPQPDVKTAAGH